LVLPFAIAAIAAGKPSYGAVPLVSALSSALPRDSHCSPGIDFLTYFARRLCCHKVLAPFPCDLGAKLSVVTPTPCVGLVLPSGAGCIACVGSFPL
jgi:hypothetical protein